MELQPTYYNKAEFIETVRLCVTVYPVRAQLVNAT